MDREDQDQTAQMRSLILVFVVRKYQWPEYSFILTSSILSTFRVSLTEKFANYYGNLRGLLLGSNLAGRRANPDNIFPEEAQLTAYKKEKDKDNKEGTSKYNKNSFGIFLAVS